MICRVPPNPNHSLIFEKGSNKAREREALLPLQELPCHSQQPVFISEARQVNRHPNWQRCCCRGSRNTSPTERPRPAAPEPPATRLQLPNGPCPRHAPHRALPLTPRRRSPPRPSSPPQSPGAQPGRGPRARPAAALAPPHFAQGRFFLISLFTRRRVKRRQRGGRGRRRRIRRSVRVAAQRDVHGPLLAAAAPHQPRPSLPLRPHGAAAARPQRGGKLARTGRWLGGISREFTKGASGAPPPRPVGGRGCRHLRPRRRPHRPWWRGEAPSGTPENPRCTPGEGRTEKLVPFPSSGGPDLDPRLPGSPGSGLPLPPTAGRPLPPRGCVTRSPGVRAVKASQVPGRKQGGERGHYCFLASAHESGAYGGFLSEQKSGACSQAMHRQLQPPRPCSMFVRFSGIRKP